MEKIDVIKEIGLSEKESKVYITLIELGKTTTGPLVKKTNIPSSKIYNILENLIDKGLVTYVISSSKKYFVAGSPDKLYSIYENKLVDMKKYRDKVKSIIEDLEKYRKKSKESHTIIVYEGVEGIKTLQEEIIKNLGKGDEVFLVGKTELVNPSLLGYFKDFHKRRVKKGIIYKTIKNSEAKRFKFIEKFPNTQVKYLPLSLYSPALIQIFQEKVAIMLYEPLFIAFVIDSKKVAQTFKAYFNGIWKIAKN